MRLVLDTNVFISGVFFAGPPFDILKSWRVGQVEIVVSAEILDEYRRVGVELSEKYTAVDLTPFLERRRKPSIARSEYCCARSRSPSVMSSPA
jgi:hypothetical protein